MVSTISRQLNAGAICRAGSFWDMSRILRRILRHRFFESAISNSSFSVLGFIYRHLAQIECTDALQNDLDLFRCDELVCRKSYQFVCLALAIRKISTLVAQAFGSLLQMER